MKVEQSENVTLNARAHRDAADAARQALETLIDEIASESFPASDLPRGASQVHAANIQSGVFGEGRRGGRAEARRRAEYKRPIEVGVAFVIVAIVVHGSHSCPVVSGHIIAYISGSPPPFNNKARR